MIILYMKYDNVDFHCREFLLEFKKGISDMTIEQAKRIWPNVDLSLPYKELKLKLKL